MSIADRRDSIARISIQARDGLANNVVTIARKAVFVESYKSALKCRGHQIDCEWHVHKYRKSFGTSLYTLNRGVIVEPGGLPHYGQSYSTLSNALPLS